jgi:hypothetical protein
MTTTTQLNTTASDDVRRIVSAVHTMVGQGGVNTSSAVAILGAITDLVNRTIHDPAVRDAMIKAAVADIVSLKPDEVKADVLATLDTLSKSSTRLAVVVEKVRDFFKRFKWCNK